MGIGLPVINNLTLFFRFQAEVVVADMVGTEVGEVGAVAMVCFKYIKIQYHFLYQEYSLSFLIFPEQSFYSFHIFVSLQVEVVEEDVTDTEEDDELNQERMKVFEFSIFTYYTAYSYVEILIFFFSLKKGYCFSTTIAGRLIGFKRNNKFCKQCVLT